MTDDVTPATDEEIAKLREELDEDTEMLAKILARIDAEREAREKAESDHKREAEASWQIRIERDKAREGICWTFDHDGDGAITHEALIANLRAERDAATENWQRLRDYCVELGKADKLWNHDARAGFRHIVEMMDAFTMEKKP